MDYFLSPAELYEAEAEFAAWQAETGNDPQTIFENMIEDTEDA